MRRSSDSSSSPPIVERYFVKEQENFVATQDWNQFVTSFDQLNQAIDKKGILFDPRFNAVNWAFNVNSLCQEIVYGYCWMKAYAKYYREDISRNSQPTHTDFHVSYFADNCITRIDSCQDKLALMVWAYYCPFNPEYRDEVLDYSKIIERLEFPVKFGITIREQDIFLTSLKKLEGEDFKRIEKYRHLKIHRMEPRIEMYDVASHHDIGYMVPVLRPKDIEEFDRDLSDTYPDEQFRNLIRNGCKLDEVLFDRKAIKDTIWAFDEVENHIKSCSFKLLNTSSECFQELSNRAPLIQ